MCDHRVLRIQPSWETTIRLSLSLTTIVPKLLLLHVFMDTVFLVLFIIVLVVVLGRRNSALSFFRWYLLHNLHETAKAEGQIKFRPRNREWLHPRMAETNPEKCIFLSQSMSFHVHLRNKYYEIGLFSSSLVFASWSQPRQVYKTTCWTLEEFFFK